MTTKTFIGKQIAFALFILIIGVANGFAQKDTLHIFYQGYSTKMLDSNETKIGNWAKSLKGKHVNVDVLCYYYDSEHKKEAAERSEEMFLILNRKARELITINSNAPKKGEKSQRTRVDIVYSFADGSGAITSDKKTEVKEEKTDSKKKEESKEKISKSETKSDSKQKDSDKSKEKEKKESSESTTKKEQPASTEQVNEDTDDTYTIYVNGEKKVMKKKNTKKK